MIELKVFISHRQVDAHLAKAWAIFLANRGIASYLDVLDPTPQKLNGRAVSRYLHDQLKACTHMLVIFTENTIGSMWMPFEIGVATERDIGIAIDLNVPTSKLPGYLLEWPVMQTKGHYEAFANQLRSTEAERRYFKSLDMRYSENFHTSLKQAIARL